MTDDWWGEPMKAYIEWLVPRAAGIVRVGPDCSCWHAPFEYAVAFKVVDPEALARGDRSIATIKALVAPQKKQFKWTHACAILDVLCAERLDAEWERVRAAR